MNSNTATPQRKTSAPKLLAHLLDSHSVKNIFVSPGSRNAAIISALAECGTFNLHSVIDERSAAFAALGYANTADETTAIVCTSGSAPLNYAPAVAEAFYRRTPLIIITADRPTEWIDQDDSQTIVQPGLFKNIIKGSYDIPVLKDEASVWYANRIINEALILAVSGRKGPVHINMQLAQPTIEVPAAERHTTRAITVEHPREELDVAECAELSKSVANTPKVMIISGFQNPSATLNQAMTQLATLPNVAILTETISNLVSSHYINAIDLTLSAIDDNETNRFVPDIVITMGGALISRHLKAFLRKNPPAEHWHVGINETVIDCFCSISKIIKVKPERFFGQLAQCLRNDAVQKSDYATRWEILKNKAIARRQAYTAKAPWSDLQAFDYIISHVPKRWNVHFSNGTPIRYAQLFGEHNYHRCDCNRGVSGIDGCTSTAVGASLAYGDTTLLVSGDTSAYYDMAGMGMGLITPRFKMIVIQNGGGGIFRFIDATRNLAIREQFLCGKFHFPLQQLSEAFGFKYFRAASIKELTAAMPHFIAEQQQPTLLEVVTPSELSASVLRELLN